MNTYQVAPVGHGTPVSIEAHNAIEAVAEAAQCATHMVCLPIWREGPDRLRETYAVECYMPLDGTGRQWLVSK